MSVFLTEDLPVPIVQHLQAFSEQRPDWTQARVLNNALSLFLLQNGIEDRAISQVYLQSMFGDLARPASDETEGGLS